MVLKTNVVDLKLVSKPENPDNDSDDIPCAIRHINYYRNIHDGLQIVSTIHGAITGYTHNYLPALFLLIYF